MQTTVTAKEEFQFLRKDCLIDATIMEKLGRGECNNAFLMKIGHGL